MAPRQQTAKAAFRKGPFKSTGSYDSEREGWSECFDRLEQYLEQL